MIHHLGPFFLLDTRHGGPQHDLLLLVKGQSQSDIPCARAPVGMLNLLIADNQLAELHENRSNGR